MSCGCMNRKLSAELERARKLAKALARLEGETVVLYLKQDGTYGFDVKRHYSDVEDNKIIEYITKY